MQWAEIRRRTLAFALGSGLTLGALWGGLVVLLLGGIAAQPPDALAPDGDPCCPVPDTWAAVVAWSALALIAAALDAAVLALGGALLWFAVRHRWPGRKVTVLPLYAPALVAVLLVAGLIAGLL